ncbi:MAG: DUF4142 domain-containing protein [Archangium sp.]|nr:DUF4142 domain-containing protein [Archangium sp.]
MRSLQLAASLLSLTAWAQPALSPADRTFVTTAANEGLAAVELGRLAMNLGLNKEVRDAGARLVADHEKANEALQKAVTPWSMVLPGKTDEAHQRQLDMLAQLMGSDFDSTFSKHLLVGHQRTVQLFRDQAKTGQVRALRAFAADTLPMLERHLKFAKELARGRSAAL